MSCLTRSVIRWGLIGGLALGGLTLLVGPERVAAGFSQVRAKAQSMFDSNISDPVALRRQLVPMHEQYESRLSELNGAIAAVEHQISEAEYEVDVARLVVQNTTEDLQHLKKLVMRAESETESTARPVNIRFNGVRFDVDQAYNEARRLNAVRQASQDRLAHGEPQLAFLHEQRDRLIAVRDEIETEFNTFQAQVWQLERQIDSIERNERLIELTKQQQATLASYERMGEIGNLKQLEGKLAELRAVQDAQLKALDNRGLHKDYEAKARRQLRSGMMPGAGNAGSDDPFRGIDAGNMPASDEQRRDDRKADRSVAWSGPVIIE